MPIPNPDVSRRVGAVFNTSIEFLNLTMRERNKIARLADTVQSFKELPPWVQELVIRAERRLKLTHQEPAVTYFRSVDDDPLIFRIHTDQFNRRIFEIYDPFRDEYIHDGSLISYFEHEGTNAIPITPEDADKFIADKRERVAKQTDMAIEWRKKRIDLALRKLSAR